eukprot:198674_1
MVFTPREKSLDQQKTPLSSKTTDAPKSRRVIIVRILCFLTLIWLCKFAWDRAYFLLVVANRVPFGHSRSGLKPAAKLSEIPRHVHQIFLQTTRTPRAPPKWTEFQKNWKSLKGFNHTLWDDAKVEKLLESRFPHLSRFYHGYASFVQRVDMAKYMILHEHGGIYADLDVGPKHAFLRSLTNNRAFRRGVVMYETVPIGYATDFLTSTPKHPFLSHLLAEIENVPQTWLFPYWNCMCTIGPLFLTYAVNTYHYKDQLGLIPEGDQHRFIRYTKGDSWHEFDAQLFLGIFQHGWVFMCLVIVCAFGVYYFRVINRLFTLFKRATSISHSPRLTQVKISKE